MRDVTGSAGDRFRRVDAIFDAVLDEPAETQEEFIARACGHDAAMRAEVLGLLRAFRASDGFLESPAVRLSDMLAEPPASAVPERLGAFRIVREIGRGGMGAVYLGERDDGQFEQRVALKLIHRSTPGIVQRFMTERRILARLEHPAIARLIDGGVTHAGLPWFAMELVEGEPVDRYCARHGLGVARRLELFTAVCDAVSFAHTHLVIHRDLKPSNILVTAAGQVKLLDFGIATLLQADAATPDTVAHTELIALTPEFAAPEQVMGQPVSTATDVYALGVLLYLLLTDERPYDVRGRSLPEIQRLICADDPPAPSVTARAGLRSRLRGDLDVIVMKALRKDPAQRYASVQELSDDIRRHLSGHPVQARALTFTYRARRFARRHRWSLAAAAVFAALLSTYAITLTVQQARIRRALDEARTGAQRAEQVTDFMLGLFEASEQGQAFADTLTARRLLGRGLAQARELQGRPEVRAQMLDAVGQLHMQLGEYDRARAVFDEALALRRMVLRDGHVDIGASLANVAAAAHRTGDYESALRLRREALVIRRRELGSTHSATLETLYWHAHALHESGAPEEATPFFDEWIRAVSAAPPEVTPSRATQYLNLGQMLVYRGEHARAERFLTQALQMRRILYGDRHAGVARATSTLAAMHLAAGRLDLAERLERESVTIMRALHPDGHPDLASALRNHAVALHRLGRWADAEQLYLEQIALVRRFHGADHTFFGTAVEDLAILYHRQRRFAEAGPYAEEAVRVYRGNVGAESLLTRRAEVILGDVLLQRGDSSAAEVLLLGAFDALKERSVPGFEFALGIAARSLTALYESRGRSEEAGRFRAVLSRLPPRPQRG
jgi:eukaryotic-like serine/threonine-protein kinase